VKQESNVSQTFLQDFFGDGNAIGWDQYETAASTDPVRVSLEPWVQRFQKQQSPFLLPRVDLASNLTTWYVLCKEPREARSMRESLLAFVGPTYTEFNGEMAMLEPADPIDCLCAANFGSFVFRLPVKNPKDRTRVGKLLSTLVEYRDCESNRSLAAVKPIGRLLRDLEMAILANNEQSAWTVYSEIRSRGRLSATNLAFLQVRILGAFEHWAELLQLPNLNDLLHVRRPKRISEQIAQAVYQRDLLKHEIAEDAASAVNNCRGEGIRYQNLVRSTEGLQSPDAIKFALVVAVASNPPKRDLAEKLSKHSAIAMDAAWATALLATLPVAEHNQVVAETVTTLDVADERYNENNFDEAFVLYLDQPQTYRSVCRVLETAVEVDTLNAATDALAYLADASEDIRGDILGRRVCTNHIEFLTRILGQDSEGEPKPISSLTEWFKFVDEGDALQTAVEVLKYGIQDWVSTSSFDATVLAGLLQETRTGRQAEIIRNAVPTFIRALLVDRLPSRQCKPVYRALTELLIYDESVGGDDLVFVEQLTEAILTIAPSHEAGKNDFAAAAEVAVYLWDSLAAPRHLDWGLSMLDLLIDTGGQQHANLTQVLAAIADSSRAWARRVSDEQWSFLELLASDLSLSELTSGLRPELDETVEEAKPAIRDTLAGKSIAVYSLTERIARRFGQLAEQAFDGIMLHYIHDKCLTDRMKSLAQSADIFIVNTWDAKHAATNGIKDNRSRGLPVLQPLSKSASSMLSALIDFADVRFKDS
jgi:hypothetical protein